MAKGDHIQVPQYLVLTHDGIDCGNGRVVEYSKETGCIREISMAQFANGRAVSFVRYDANSPDVFDADEVVRRARSRVNERNYDLFGNNCEHFATWCKTGRHCSRQVDGATSIASAVAMGFASLLMLGAVFARGRA